MRFRSQLQHNIELLIPMAIGLVPLFVIRLAIRLVTRKRAPAARVPRPRSPVGVVEVALAALVLAVPVAGWAVSSKAVDGVQATVERDRTSHLLTFEADGHG